MVKPARSTRRPLRVALLVTLLLAEVAATVLLSLAEARAAAFRAGEAGIEAGWEQDVAAGVPAASFIPLQAALSARASEPGWSYSWIADPGTALLANVQSQSDVLFQQALGAAEVRAQAALASLTTAAAAARAAGTGESVELGPDLDDLRSASTPIELDNLAASWEQSADQTRLALKARSARDTEGWQTLYASLSADAAASGGTVSVGLIELGGPTPLKMEINADLPLDAASTFKLPVLVTEGNLLAAGSISLSDTLCYTDSDWSPGYFSDYYDGACFSRGDLLQRTGLYSDNTAANILIRDLGGPAQLNVLAQQQGATESAFWSPNITTAADLAAIWRSEVSAGASAHGYVYPLLTNTMYEAGIPAGVPAGVTVVHKVGDDGTVVHDAALVQGSPNGDYILVVMTQLPAGDSAAWAEVAQISAAVWEYEFTR